MQRTDEAFGSDSRFLAFVSLSLSRSLSISLALSLSLSLSQRRTMRPWFVADFRSSFLVVLLLVEVLKSF